MEGCGKECPHRAMIIPEKTVEKIRVLYQSGKAVADIAEATGVPATQISALKRKEKWKREEGVMLAVQAEVQKHDALAAKELLEVAESSLAAGGKAHSELIFKKAHAALAATKLPPLKTWKDIEIADRIARRAAGLDKEGGGGRPIINLGILAGGFQPKPAIDTTATPVTDEQSNP